ncbi:MAG: NAD(P)/FAD-dependent oxidoreductase [Actinomycetota bacterium]|nr:NAD(P)/FAD-dependent oxidoreductase [Actinomycetota bacterium]
MDPAADVVVIGAGPAGLAAAARLTGAGIATVVLERSAVGASWRARHDRLRLNSLRWLSRLPGLAMPRSAGRWVPRDDLVRYLERYADRAGITVRTGVSAERVDHDDGGCWVVRTSAGDVRARQVVVATGNEKQPVLPAWPGQQTFAGRLLHARDYGRAESYDGEDVLVVGPGISGTEVAGDLAARGTGRVWLSVRTPPTLVARELGHVPLQPIAVGGRYLPAAVQDRILRLVSRATVGDLRSLGLPDPDEGGYSHFRRTGVGPSIDLGFAAQLRAGRVQLVAPISRIEGSEVVLADGRRLSPATVIAATGYRPDLGPLVGHLGVLDARGRPCAVGGRAAAPGLRFMGFSPQLTGDLREFRLQSRSLLRAVRRELAATDSRASAPSRLRAARPR